MKKITSYLWVMVAVIALAACSNQSFKKTKSGLLYSIISDGKGETVKKGQYLKISFVEKIHDSLLNSSAKELPEYIRVDSVGPVYNPVEVFPLLRKGDSATIVMLADTLQHKYGGQLPPFVRKKDKIVLSLRVLDVFTSDEAYKADQKANVDVVKDKEVKKIEEYLAANNIKAQKTKDGVYYQITTAGTGPKADSGKIVSIRYTGYALGGGPFDSNMDSTKQKPPYHPMSLYQFKAGVSGAIRGIVSTILEFRQGDKGTMYIPSMLGYGPQGSGTTIKPFENLMFDIELVEVKDAPEPKTFMPPGRNPQINPKPGVKPSK